MTLVISYIEHRKPHPTWKNHTEPLRIILFRNISERCAFVILLPPHCTPKMMTVLEHFQKIRFRYLAPPSPLHPKMALTISLWNIIKPHPFWKNNLSEPFRIILFWKNTLLLPYSPPTAPPPKKDPRYLINRTSERFGKIRFLNFTPPSLHPKNDTRYLIYQTS